MKNNKVGFLRNGLAFISAFVFMSILSACSDSEVAGGSSDDAGIYAVKDLNVAGLTQKGPFAKGSAVTVQGIDCQTMELTEEKFTGSVKSDKGDFGVENVNLSVTCALFEVTGYYFNELTGKKSSEKMTLHALTDLKDRKNVNINLLTQLEYERVMNLVTKKDKSFADAKKQAEKEVLAAFSVNAKDGEFAQFEDLNILEKGDDNAALLAVSVMMQSDLKVTKLAERVKDVAADIAKDGSWDDDKTKMEIAEWAATADKNGELANVGKNIEKWGGSDDVSAFETVVEKFAENVASDTVPGTSSSSVTSAGSVTLNSSSSKNVLSSGSREGSSDSTEYFDWSLPKESYLNPNIKYDSIIDSRDGKVYKTVKIGNQIWMAENLNYADSVKMPSLKGNSWCYDKDPKKCNVSGRLYSWAAAIDSVKFLNAGMKCGDYTTCPFPKKVQGICPDGWHLPDTTEWNALIDAVGENAGKVLKSRKGWYDNGNGLDSVGFSVIPAGYFDKTENLFYRDGRSTGFWSTVEYGKYTVFYTPLEFSSDFAYKESLTHKAEGFSIRCIKETASATPSSSSSVNSSSSVALVTPCKTNTEDNCEYGTLMDSRDGQVYKTVKIGDQIWMAQNLNYAYLQSTDDLDSISFCYNDSLKYCDKYGRLYTWAAAIDSVKLYDGGKGVNCGFLKTCTLPVKLRGVCPEGWHLPSYDEWNTLFTSVGGSSIAGKMLKSTSGWYSGGEDGTDAFGFSALPAGFWNYNFGDVIFNYDGYGTLFWSASEGDRDFAYNVYLCYVDKNADLGYDGKNIGYSVRCLKD